MAIDRVQLIKDLEPGLNAVYGTSYKTTVKHGYGWTDVRGVYGKKTSVPTKVQMMQNEIDSLKAKLEAANDTWRRMMDEFK